jgi:hypothetical protein
LSPVSRLNFAQQPHQDAIPSVPSPTAGTATVKCAEPDEDRIVMNYRSREAGAREQRFRARLSALVDAELSIRAARVDVPVVAAWPWTDSLDLG